MNYKDFEVVDAASTIPASEGLFTTSMGIALLAFFASVTVLVVALARRHKEKVEAQENPEEERAPARPWKLTAGAAVALSLISAGLFAVEALTPDERRLEASQEQVASNYDKLFNSYGLEAPKDVDQVKIGDVVAAVQPGSGEETIVKLKVVDDKVILAHLNGGEYAAGKEDQ